MPITLTITDDQALEIVSQISAVLANRQKGLLAETAPQEQTPPIPLRKRAARVRAEVKTYHKNQIFRNSDIQSKLNLPASSITPALAGLRADGKIAMLKRGTWQVIA